MPLFLSSAKMLSTADNAPAAPDVNIADLHESVISRIMHLAGPKGLLAMRTILRSALDATNDYAGAWKTLRFSEHDASLRFADIARMLGFAKGTVEEFRLAR